MDRQTWWLGAVMVMVGCSDGTPFNGRNTPVDAAAAVDARGEVATGDVATGDVATGDVAMLGDAAVEHSAPADLGPDVASLPDTAIVAPDARDVPVVADAAWDSSLDAGLDAAPVTLDAESAFCSGEQPRLILNGTASTPTVTGRSIPYDCCDGAQFDVSSPTFALPIVFSWRRSSEPGFGYPVSVDLAQLPAAWSVRLYAGCDPLSASCTLVSDAYTSGFQGSLTVALAGRAMDMSLCLHVQEPADARHSIVHSMDLYAPHVQAM